MKSRLLKTEWFAALAALVIAVVAAGGATYAWFAHNSTVYASGMQVRVKAEGSYLLIAPGNLTTAGAGAVQAINSSEAAAVTAEAELFPAAHREIASPVTISKLEAISEGNMSAWYYRRSSDPSHKLGDAPTAELSIAADKFGEYVLANTFSLSIALGGNDMKNILVDECRITGNSAVRVLVASATGAEEFTATGSGSNVLIPSLSDSDVALVNIYVYWDGNADNVTTNNKASLLDTSVEVSFVGTVSET